MSVKKCVENYNYHAKESARPGSVEAYLDHVENYLRLGGKLRGRDVNSHAWYFTILYYPEKNSIVLERRYTNAKRILKTDAPLDSDAPYIDRHILDEMSRRGLEIDYCTLFYQDSLYEFCLALYILDAEKHDLPGLANAITHYLMQHKSPAEIDMLCRDYIKHHGKSAIPLFVAKTVCENLQTHLQRYSAMNRRLKNWRPCKLD